GMAIAADKEQAGRKVVAVIGDVSEANQNVYLLGFGLYQQRLIHDRERAPSRNLPPSRPKPIAVPRPPPW
ncbi:hypothetical protein L9G74_21715, partial [Shewanella sp. C32]